MDHSLMLLHKRGKGLRIVGKAIQDASKFVVRRGMCAILLNQTNGSSISFEKYNFEVGPDNDTNYWLRDDSSYSLRLDSFKTKEHQT